RLVAARLRAAPRDDALLRCRVERPARATAQRSRERMAVSTGVEGLLGAARTRIARWTPAQAFLLVREGALLVDIRPESQRRTHGEVPYGLVIERNVLEWRLDPTS